MKILRIIPSMNPKLGGPGQGIRNLIPALKELGVENEVVCFDDINSEFLKDINFVVHALGHSKRTWAYNPRLPVWLERNLPNYNVVIIHGLWLYHDFASVKSILKYRGNTKSPKVYIMPHGMLDPWFQRDKTRRLKAIRNEMYWWLIEKNVVNNADGLFFTCEQELLLARETFYGYHPKGEYNIGYGIQPPPQYHMEMQIAFLNQYKLNNGRPYILFLSRIHPKKGIDILIDVYLDLEKEISSLPDLVIAGPLDGDFANSMRDKAKKSKQIHFTGMLQGNAKWGAFYNCEAFILPSHQENFGISVAEALACGKPVLISDQINIFREIVSGGGGLIGNDTPIGVRNLLTNWLGLSTEDRKKMSERAREIYLKEFSIQQAALRLKSKLFSLSNA